MNNGTFIILLTATFPTLSILAFLFSLGAYLRSARANSETIQRGRDLERAVVLQWRILRHHIDMAEQERLRVRSLDDTLNVTQARQEAQRARSEQECNATNDTKCHHTRAEPAVRDTERSVNRSQHDAQSDSVLEEASNVRLPPSPTEQQINEIIHEQPQEQPTIADRHREGPNVYSSFPEETAASEDTLLARVEEARICLLRSKNSARTHAARNSEPQASSVTSGKTHASLESRYNHSPPLTNGDKYTALTNVHYHPALTINGDTQTTTHGLFRSPPQRPDQQITATPNHADSKPGYQPTTTTRIRINDLAETLVRVLRETEPRPSEAQIQTIASAYVRELRESRQRQFEDLSEDISLSNRIWLTVSGGQTNSGAVNTFHIDGGIVRNENAVNCATVNVPNINNITTVWPIITPRSIPRLGGRNSAHPGFPLLGPSAPNGNLIGHFDGVGSYGRQGPERNDDTASRWYDDNESEENLPNSTNNTRQGTIANGRGVPSSPSNFGSTTNGIRSTYATVAAEDLESTGSRNWTPIARLSSWDPNFTQAIGRNGTNLTAERRFMNESETGLDDRGLMNDTDLDELRGFRNEPSLRRGIGDGRPVIEAIPPPLSTSTTRSNSLSGTTLVNSIPSLSGSTLVNSTTTSSNGDTPPPSTLGDSHINIDADLYRNGAYETRLAAIRRRRAMSDMRSIARGEETEHAAIPIDETGRRGAVAIGYDGPLEQNPPSEEEGEREAIREAEQRWWGLRNERASRRDSIEEEMVAHILGRKRTVGTEMVNGVDDEDEPHVNGEMASDEEKNAESAVGGDQAGGGRTARE